MIFWEETLGEDISRTLKFELKLFKVGNLLRLVDVREKTD